MKDEPRQRRLSWFILHPSSLNIREDSLMSNISATAVKALRDRTNLPMMDCKAALTEANGDMDKAVDILRKKNAAIQAKKGDRETAEGRVAVFLEPARKV